MLRFKSQFVCWLMMQSGWAGLIRLSSSGSWGWDGAYPRCHRVKGVVHPRCETNHTLSHLHPIKSHVSGHRDQHASESDKCFKESMLAWSSSSDFPGPGEARWSQVKPGGLSQCCWLPVLQTGGAKHAEPQSPIQPTLEGWKCGNFTTVIILRVTFLHRNENTKKVKSSLHMKVLCLYRCCKLYGNGRFNEGGKTETRCFSPKGGSMSPLHLSGC